MWCLLNAPPLVKIFIGFQLAIDLKMKLNQTQEWKQFTVMPGLGKNPLIIIPYDKHEYIGRYSDANLMTLADIRLIAKAIKNAIQSFSPEYDLDALKFSVFPQVFIA